ncbi:hypothetical protein COLO4_09352 [Corchorus olitorius]|uniref:Uncharacterized protein n=1 Tax=Corchorus olitorius TaxID=93759 RepID=A0A1R3KCC2_9ROSI|nr:hypothetical protein COLO4_09352 [Corchorus olitorius]
MGSFWSSSRAILIAVTYTAGELHRRRLQIKAKSKIPKKPKDRTKKIPAEGCSTRDSQEADSNAKIEASSVPNLKGRGEDENPFAQQDNVGEQLAPKKRQKLHWGLDTKERWERKANM